MWQRFTAEGTEWEVRVVPDESGAAGEEPVEVLEFRSSDPNRPPRRLYVTGAEARAMDEAGLRRALRQARPIGGDYYGRPGKRMPDERQSSPARQLSGREEPGARKRRPDDAQG